MLRRTVYSWNCNWLKSVWQLAVRANVLAIALLFIYLWKTRLLTSAHWKIAASIIFPICKLIFIIHESICICRAFQINVFNRLDRWPSRLNSRHRRWTTAGKDSMWTSSYLKLINAKLCSINIFYPSLICHFQRWMNADKRNVMRTTEKNGFYIHFCFAKV